MPIPIFKRRKYGKDNSKPGKHRMAEQKSEEEYTEWLTQIQPDEPPEDDTGPPIPDMIP